MAWKSQRTRALDLAVSQSETSQRQLETLRSELTSVNSELASLHRELARRDVELIGALAQVSAVTDQLRLQNEQDRAHHDRLDRAIELLTMVITSSAPAPAIDAGSDGVEIEAAAPGGATVIGGSVDPSLLPPPGAADPMIDLTATSSPVRRRDAAV